MHPNRNTRTLTNRFYRLVTRETALNYLYPRKTAPTMGFQTKYSTGLTLPEYTAPGESDSESVTSTITKKKTEQTLQN